MRLDTVPGVPAWKCHVASYRDDPGVWSWLVGLVGTGWCGPLCPLLTEGSVQVTEAAARGFYVTNNLRRRR